MFSSETIDTSATKKRGRKATTTNYFDVVEENAVRLYLSATTFDEKNQIYNEYLRGPLDKMISSIIRRLRLINLNLLKTKKRIHILELFVRTI